MSECDKSQYYNFSSEVPKKSLKALKYVTRKSFGFAKRTQNVHTGEDACVQLCEKWFYHVCIHIHVIVQECISTCGFVTYVLSAATYHLALAMGVLGGALLPSTPTLTTPVKSLTTSAVRWERIYTH